MEYRKLFPNEESLLDALLKKAKVEILPLWKEDLVVKPMSDGGMGSLLLFPHGPTLEGRSFGRQVCDLEFKDTDGTKVIASLNVDSKGELFELDLWKTDYSPIHEIPGKFE